MGVKDDIVVSGATPNTNSSPEDLVCDHSVFEAARECMNGDEDAQLYLLGVEQGMKRQQIAEELGWEPREVDNARERVRNRLIQADVPWLTTEESEQDK